MEYPNVLITYGSNETAYFDQEGTCPKIYFDVRGESGQEPLLVVEDGGLEADTLLFGPSFET